MILRKDLLQALNDTQKEAVISGEKKFCVWQVLESGKTTVLTKRTAYLLNSRVSPRNVVCITFTRAAGNEMHKRIINIDEKGKEIFCDTFHKFCIAILNRYGDRIGIYPNFSIIAQEQRSKVIQSIAEEFNYKFNCKNGIQ